MCSPGPHTQRPWSSSLRIDIKLRRLFLLLKVSFPLQSLVIWRPHKNDSDRIWIKTNTRFTLYGCPFGPDTSPMQSGNGLVSFVSQVTVMSTPWTPGPSKTNHPLISPLPGSQGPWIWGVREIAAVYLLGPQPRKWLLMPSWESVSTLGEHRLCPSGKLRNVES